VFWRGWPSDEPLPRSAVVTDETLVEKLDGGGARPERDDGDDRPRRSTPGADRPRSLDAITRNGKTTDVEEYNGTAPGDADG